MKVNKQGRKTKNKNNVSEEPNITEAVEAIKSAHRIRKEWLAIRKKAGRQIDPKTAEVWWIFAQTLDPYGIYPELPEEYNHVEEQWFARSAGSDIWVCFSDLPDATRDALWEN